MFFLKLLRFTLFFISLNLFGEYPNFFNNPYLTKEIRKEIFPYLLPLDHPIKDVLDQIFRDIDVIESKQSLCNAGFSIITHQQKSAIFVTKHPLAPGYVFKLYCNSHPSGRENKRGWECLTLRCKNARKVKKIINTYGIEHFSVPDKWLYILPPSQKKSSNESQFLVLVATDMEICSAKATKLAWKKEITTRHLDELYLILSKGYGSSYLLNNIPFTKHKTFALIDLEKERRDIPLARIEKYFSRDMKAYWNRLIDN